MSGLTAVLNGINTAVWGFPMLALLMGTHIFMTFRTRGIQRLAGRAIKLSVTKDGSAGGDISPFGALMTTLAATLGTGNIIGVATAVISGGPGAVFWCWLTGIFGMATKYSECLLAVKYRVKTSDGTMLGGPMYTLERGMGNKLLGSAFAMFAMFASFGIGSSVQANAVTETVRGQFGVNQWVTALVVTALAAAAIFKGVKSISAVCSVLVPFMAGFYILGNIVILVFNALYLGETVSAIFRGAFSFRAVGGGIMGGMVNAAMRYGVARGLFSNEAGLGSAPIAAAAAKTRDTTRQALVSMTATFWDTVVMCAMTGIVIVSSMLRYPDTMGAADATSLMRMSFGQIHAFGSAALTVCIAMFAFSTIIGWSYYGERCAEYLFGKRAIPFYKAVYIAAVLAGGTARLELVWAASDTLNFLMAVPNISSVLALSGVVARETREKLWGARDAIRAVKPAIRAGARLSPARRVSKARKYK